MLSPVSSWNNIIPSQAAEARTSYPPWTQLPTTYTGSLRLTDSPSRVAWLRQGCGQQSQHDLEPGVLITLPGFTSPYTLGAGVGGDPGLCRELSMVLNPRGCKKTLVQTMLLSIGKDPASSPLASQSHRLQWSPLPESPAPLS